MVLLLSLSLLSFFLSQTRLQVGELLLDQIFRDPFSTRALLCFSRYELIILWAGAQEWGKIVLEIGNTNVNKNCT